MARGTERKRSCRSNNAPSGNNSARAFSSSVVRTKWSVHTVRSSASLDDLVREPVNDDFEGLSTRLVTLSESSVSRQSVRNRAPSADVSGLMLSSSDRLWRGGALLLYGGAHRVSGSQLTWRDKNSSDTGVMLARSIPVVIYTS